MLIRCKECGKDVSDQAPACPSCGVGLKAPAKKKTSALTIVVGVIVLVMAVGYVYGLFLAPFR